MSGRKGDHSFEYAERTDKGLPLQTASPLEPPFTQTTDHPDLVPLANGSTDPSNTEINHALTSRMHVRTAGSSATTTSGTSSAPQRTFNDIIKFLEKELEPRPRPLIACCIKQNDEPERTSADAPLEQRKEKRMNVEITLDPTAKTSQWVELPTGVEQTPNDNTLPASTCPNGLVVQLASRPGVSHAVPQEVTVHDAFPSFPPNTKNDNTLSLSLIVGGDRHRGILGSVGPYCSANTEVLEFLQVPGFSPTLEIGVGTAVNVGFKFKKYPRDLDSREQAFRVLCIIQDSRRRVVAYGSSNSAYHIRAHPRRPKRPRLVPDTESEIQDQGSAKRRRTDQGAVAGPSGTNSTLDPSSSSSAGGGSAHSVANIVPSTSLLPAQGPLQGNEHIHVHVTSESSPTLTEVIPASCNWRGGIYVSLLIDNWPLDGRIFARFGSIVVATTRKRSDLLVCKVPPASAPCEVEVTLSRGPSSSEPPYGFSLCRFVYEEDDVTRLVYSMKASASGLDDLQIAEIIRQKGILHGYTPLQSWSGFSTSIPCNNLSPIRWSEPARVELVREGGEKDSSEEGSVYMEVHEVMDPPTLGDQSDTHEGTPAESVLVSEGDITSWLRAVPGDLAPPTPSPLILSSPPEATSLSGMQRAAVQSPPPIYPSNHQSLPPSLTRPARQLPERPTPIRLEASPGSAGKTQGDDQRDRYSFHHRRSRHTSPRISGARVPCLSTPAFEAGTSNTSDLNVEWPPPPTASNQRLSFPMVTRYTTDHEMDMTYSIDAAILPMPLPVSQVNPVPDTEEHVDYQRFRLQAVLKDPKDRGPTVLVEIRREKKVVLGLVLYSDSRPIEGYGWGVIQLPQTRSVQSDQRPLPRNLPKLSIQVLGGLSGAPNAEPCSKCWDRERQAINRMFCPANMQPYMIDFKSKSLTTALSKPLDGNCLKADVTFHFTCYSKHHEGTYKLIVKLHDEFGHLVAKSLLPYEFVVKANSNGTGNGRTRLYRSARQQTQQLRPDPSSAPSLEVGSPGLFASSHPVPMDDPSQHISSRITPALRKLSPSDGPINGGPIIMISGTNFPPPNQQIIYARFGNVVVPTTWQNPFTLECQLPPSLTWGTVQVTLSRYQEPEKPQFNWGHCLFKYNSYISYNSERDLTLPSPPEKANGFCTSSTATAFPSDWLLSGFGSG